LRLRAPITKAVMLSQDPCMDSKNSGDPGHLDMDLSSLSRQKVRGYLRNLRIHLSPQLCGARANLFLALGEWRNVHVSVSCKVTTCDGRLEGEASLPKHLPRHGRLVIAEPVMDYAHHHALIAQRTKASSQRWMYATKMRYSSHQGCGTHEMSPSITE
jgi:hypothetical protein